MHYCPVLIFYVFQNGMTRPGSTHDHRGDRLQEKGLDAGQVVTGGDLAQVLPTTKLATTSLLSHWKFHPNRSIRSKVIHDFPKHTHTDRQTNHPCTIYGSGEKKFMTVFSTFSLTEWARSLCFVQDNAPVHFLAKMKNWKRYLSEASKIIE